ncbi:MAG TPA: ATP-binding cassette domain-containing protein [Solirubrobacteraceae bacterium]
MEDSQVRDGTLGVIETSGNGASQLAAADAEFMRSMATLFIDVLGPFGEAMARHIHDEVRELGSDEAVVEATRTSCTSNMREIFSMLRAAIPATALVTPTDALEYGRFLRRRGVGFHAINEAYKYGVSMFRDVLGIELQERIDDRARLARIAAAADDFLFAYIHFVLDRLLKEYQYEGENDFEGRAWHPASDDPVLANPASVEAGRRFRDAQISAGRWLAATPEASKAHAESERVLDRFVTMLENAAADPEISQRLSLADTTVEIVLADEPDLSVTLLLDRTPVEVVDGGRDAEVRMYIASFDLERITSLDYKLPMAVARGRVRAEGPVRKFLRVAPILHGERERHATAADHVDVDEPRDESGFTARQRDLLDQAADYSLHSGAMSVTEQHPGDFWSVECIDVYKAFGRNRVLNGLNLGIPDGMITVILGPSGTGKSVLIKHLIGLMFPDQGDILVHGKSVPNRRRSELFEMRREFGILFQDGALFGSMNLYDNVAFPLREQTNKSEEEIRRIVQQRMEEVGLTDAADRVPSEISGGMKKRAGFARALVMEPKIVMFDEPDSGLDPVRTALLCDLIRKIHGEHGGTYIVITHDIASARRLGDYIAVLWKGRIVESGDAERMFNSDNPFVRQFLAGAPVGPLGME